MRHLSSSLPLLAACCLSIVASAGPVAAQAPGGIYYPLNNVLPPGQAGKWAAIRGIGGAGCFQPVRVEVPGGGDVTWYDGGPDRQLPLVAPAQAGLLVGPVYRIKLSNLADYPGVELYPTLELLDRLHPPEGRAADFPVPVQFTDDEIQLALSGRLVTKVIYLEQPNRAQGIAADAANALPAQRVPARHNPLHIADLQGRPILIVRLGGRLPDPTHEHPQFYGSGAPVQVITVPPAAESPAIDAEEMPEVEVEIEGNTP